MNCDPPGPSRAPLWLVVLVAAAIACGGAPATAPAPRTCTPPARPSVRLEPPVGSLPCPTAAEIAGLEVPVSFEGVIPGGTLMCRAADGSRDLGIVEKNVYTTLLFMKHVEFDAQLPWTELTMWQWFTKAVAGIRIRSDIATNGCCNPARVINLLPNTVETSTPSYIEMMVHEGRHADGHPHNCGTLDERVSDLGGYGVQYYTLIWLGRHLPRATQAEKDYALNRAALLRASAFCQECE